MGTKANPGLYDCYSKAAPDEPIFVLRANDPIAVYIVTEWAKEYNKRCYLYSNEMTDAQLAKYNEALECAQAMLRWNMQPLEPR